MATIAVFVAIGGTSYAAAKLTGKDLQAHSLTARNFHKNSVTGSAIRESTLSKVPQAVEAEHLNGVTAEALFIRCPEGTLAVSDTCIETQAHAPAYFSAALHECAAIESQPGGPGRRLPTYAELAAALTHSEIGLSAGGELTSQVYPSAASPGQVEALLVTTPTGGVALTPDNAADPHSYRCVVDPRN
ncbi:MAG: hypothetical protein JSU06_02405 [Actinobacteria bacterium]|nr:hypothetical protein [Actinomycetota bacterium]